MKILVLQLARLGDIYMTWPALRALKQKYPNSQLHLLVRPRFSGAVDGLTVIDKKWEIPMESIFEPLVDPMVNVDEASNRLKDFVKNLKNENFDTVINLSFSPFSSYLTKAITGPSTKVLGYTRHNDGYLHLIDDVSAYFYAQVGIGRPNRVHLTELFASVCGVQLQRDDFYSPIQVESNIHIPHAYYLMHIGASTRGKSFPPYKWRSVLTKVFSSTGISCVLIGSIEEQELVKQIIVAQPEGAVINLVGKTRLEDLISLAQKSMLIVGADSMAIHLGTLVNCPSLNVSFSNVHFWETGPRAEKSRVCYADSDFDLPSENVADVVIDMLNNKPYQNSANIWEFQEGIPCYQGCEQASWEWDLIQALYMEKPFPPTSNPKIYEGIKNIFDANRIIIDQIEVVKKTNSVEKVAKIINRAEEVIHAVGALVTELSPLTRWYETEKTRIPPGDLKQIVEANEKIQNLLAGVCEIYLDAHATETEPSLLDKIKSAKNLVKDLAQRIRFSKYQIHELVQTLEFLTHIHLASSKPPELDEALSRLARSIDRQDWILIADSLEFDMAIILDKMEICLQPQEAPKPTSNQPALP